MARPLRHDGSRRRRLPRPRRQHLRRHNRQERAPAAPSEAPEAAAPADADAGLRNCDQKRRAVDRAGAPSPGSRPATTAARALAPRLPCRPRGNPPQYPALVRKPEYPVVGRDRDCGRPKPPHTAERERRWRRSRPSREATQARPRLPARPPRPQPLLHVAERRGRLRPRGHRHRAHSTAGTRGGFSSVSSQSQRSRSSCSDS